MFTRSGRALRLGSPRVKDCSIAGGAGERYFFRDALKNQHRECVGIRRCGGNGVSDVLGGYIPNITSGCHCHRDRGSVDLFSNPYYSEVADKRFALSRARSAHVLRVGSELEIYLRGDDIRKFTNLPIMLARLAGFNT